MAIQSSETHKYIQIKQFRRKYILLLTICIALLLLVLAACSNFDIYEVFEKDDLSQTNIHSFCDTCHNNPDEVAGGDICLWCHKYTSNHHPTNFTPPDSELLRVEESGLPLFDGMVTCLSCHDMHGGPNLTETPMHLREGPYPDQRLLCAKCHNLDKYVEINVHKMLDNAEIRVVQGKIICTFCHLDIPNPYQDKTNDVTFKADTAFVCWRCHWTMPGELLAQHLFTKPSTEMLSRMKAYEQEHETLLPLVPRGKITCSTCHNPHQVEVMQSNQARAGAGSPNLLRISKQDLCIACHSQ